LPGQATARRRGPSPVPKEEAQMVPILLWLLGVPIGLIIVLLLLGVVHF